MNLGKTGFLLMAMTGRLGHTSGTVTAAGSWWKDGVVGGSADTGGGGSPSSGGGSELIQRRGTAVTRAAAAAGAGAAPRTRGVRSRPPAGRGRGAAGRHSWRRAWRREQRTHAWSSLVAMLGWAVGRAMWRDGEMADQRPKQTHMKNCSPLPW